MTGCEHGGGIAVTRQQRQKPFKFFPVKAEARRELPQKRTKLVAEPQHTLRNEIGERRLDVAQLLHMGDKAAALHGEDEPLRRLVPPATRKTPDAAASNACR